MWLDHSSMWSLLAALSLATIAESGYYNVNEGRSSQRASNFECKTEGYHADPQSCEIYYRCVDFGNGGPLVKFKFECGPGTVFSKAQGDICTYPSACGRKECGGTNDEDDKTNDIDSNNTHETGTDKYPPPACPVCGPSHVSGSTGTTAAVTQSTIRPSLGVSSTTSSISSAQTTTQAPNKPNLGTQCTRDGFMADPQDCKKFYRCVDEGNGSYRRYEFTCGVGTVWDPKIDTCNHPWEANRVGCKIPIDSKPPQKPSHGPGSTGTTAAVTQSTIHPSLGVSSSTGSISSAQTTTQTPNKPNLGTQCTRDGFMADPQDCKKFYRCVDEGNGSYRRYEFTCGVGTVWDPKIDTCNHPWEANRVGCKIPIDSKPPQKPSHGPGSTGTTAAVTQSTIHPSLGVSSSTGSISSAQTTTQTPNKPNLGTQCTRDGFMADPQDCKKFYRCVDEGNGSYRRYEFTCGVGTVWDPKIDTCNHPWEANRVGCKIPIDSKPPQKPSHGPGSTGTTAAVTQSTIRPSPGVSSTTGPISSTQTITQAPNKPNIGTQCTCDGFMADPQDCKKFYRCVDEGNGSYRRYEFTCGVGTVWDPKIDTCNHPWAANRVGCKVPTDSKPSHESSHVPGSTGTTPGGSSQTLPTEGSSESSPTEGSSETPPTEGPTENPPTEGSSEVPPTEVSSEVPPSTSSTEVPPLEGSSGVPPSEQGSSEVPPSQSSSDVPPSEGSTKVPPSEGSTEVSTSDGSFGSTTPGYTLNPAQGSGNQQPDGGCSKCTGEGFFANEYNCTKYYRCVSTGPGTYAKYEFSCGPGTAWDQGLLTCNYISQVASCNVNNSGKPPGNGCTEKPTEHITTQPESSSESSSLSSSSNESTSEESSGTESSSKPSEQPTPSTEGASEILPTEVPSEVPPSAGSTEIPPSEGSSEVPPFEQGSSEVPPSEGSSEVPPSEGSSEVPSTEGVSEILPTEAPSEVPPSAGSTVVPPSEVSTEVLPSEGSSEVPPAEQGSSELPPSEGSSEVPSSEGSSEVPSTEGVSETLPTEAPSEVPPSEVSTEVLPSEGSSEVPPAEQGSSELPPSEGSSEVPSSEGSSEPSSTEGASEIIPTEAPSEVPPSAGSTEVSPSEGSTEVSPSDGSSGSTTPGYTLNPGQGSGNQQPDGGCSKCTGEGFFANEYNCTKFYRCVSTGPGTYTKYEFSCGPGTAWDQGLLTCNYISQVASCNANNNGKPPGGGCTGKPAEQITTEPESSSESSSSPSSSESSSSPSSAESSSSSSSSSESTSVESSGTESSGKPCDKPTPSGNNNGIVCDKEGFYANPSHCGKFYRCVNNGNGFNVYHFDCPPGTIFDPSISVCNHPSSVYPARDCQGQSGGGGATGTTGAVATPTPDLSSSGESTTSSVTDSSATTITEQTAQPEEETSEVSTNVTSEESTTSSVTEDSATEITEQTTQPEEETSEVSTNATPDEATTASSEVTTHDSAETSTETSQSTESQEEQSTTLESASSITDETESPEATTNNSAETSTEVADSTTTSQGEQSTTVESSSNSVGGTETSAATGSTESQEATTETEQQSTESVVTPTTGGEHEGTSNCTTTGGTGEETKPCNKPEVSGTVTCPIGNLTGDQIVLVCPTGFRRHPKYCNIFYQCTSDSEMNVKIISFHCPKDTIFDEKKIRCLPENECTEPCANKAGARVYRRVDSTSMVLADMKQHETLCPGEGYYPYNRQECSNVFYKCKRDSNQVLQGYLYKCPDDFVFWQVSRRCERLTRLPMCSHQYNESKNEHIARNTPVEDYNLSARTSRHY